MFKAHRLSVSLYSRLESNKEEEEGWWQGVDVGVIVRVGGRGCEDRVLDGPASGEKGSKGRN